MLVNGLVFVVGKIAKALWRVYSFVIATVYYFRLRDKVEYFEEMLERHHAKQMTKEEVVAWLNERFTYKSDKFFDWVCPLPIQLARIEVGDTSHSFDCDDYAEALRYLFRKMGYLDVRTYTLIARKPFLTHGHMICVIFEEDGIHVFSPYEYYGKVDSKREVVSLMQERFARDEYEYFPFVI